MLCFIGIGQDEKLRAAETVELPFPASRRLGAA
jgi:hypothetical protein